MSPVGCATWARRSPPEWRATEASLREQRKGPPMSAGLSFVGRERLRTQKVQAAEMKIRWVFIAPTFASTERPLSRRLKSVEVVREYS